MRKRNKITKKSFIRRVKYWEGLCSYCGEYIIKDSPCYTDSQGKYNLCKKCYNKLK